MPYFVTYPWVFSVFHDAYINHGSCWCSIMIVLHYMTLLISCFKEIVVHDSLTTNIADTKWFEHQIIRKRTLQCLLVQWKRTQKLLVLLEPISCILQKAVNMISFTLKASPWNSSTKLFHITGKPSLGPGIGIDRNSIPPQEPQSSSKQDNEGLLLVDFNLYGRRPFLWTSWTSSATNASSYDQH